MAKQNVDVGLFYDGAYQSVPDEVFTAEQIRVQRGQGSEGAALRPAKVTLTFNNATDKWRPTNPMSPLYGKVGRNTPMRVRVDGTTRTTVEATSWSPDRTLKAEPPSLEHPNGQGRSTVDVEAYGLLGRIAQWSDPLRSPFHRVNAALTTLTGYWPMENEPVETTLRAEVPGSSTGTLRYVTAPSNDYPAGSEPLVKLGDQGFMEGHFARYGEDASGWQLSWAMRLPQQPDGSTAITPMEWELVDGSTGSMQWSGTDILLFTFGPTGAAQFNITVDGSGTDWTRWNLIRFRVSISGGTVTGELSWLTEGGGFVGTTDTYAASTTSELSRWFVGVAAGGENADTAYGHLLGTIGATEDLESADRQDSFHGWIGETAGARFLRLMSELGVTGSLMGTAGDTWPMGPQKPDTFINLLQEIARTEDALIFDASNAIAVVMRTRRDRYNQTPALALTFGLDVAAPFREILDDLDTHNHIVMAQRDGGQYEASLTTGRMSTAAPPNGVGEYRQQIDVDVEDETNDLPVLGGWWLNRGTLERSRYESVTVDLAANPDLADACNALEIGDLITVAGYEHDTIPLIVIGYVDLIGSHTRRITFTTVPAELFQPGAYDTARYDSASTSTGFSSYLPSATSIVFSTDNFGDIWATTGNGTPYDCVCDGEVFTVTAMGAASGTGPYLQTATVVRAVNGVRKTLQAGKSIHKATSGRYAL